MLAVENDDFVRLRARSGFWTEDEMAEMIAQIVDDELDGDEEEYAELMSIALEELEKLEAAELEWESATVNDRIGAAFADLNARGIIALQNAGYTMSDGWSDANEVALERIDTGDIPRGATFYHSQSLEHGVVGNGLMLAFGAYGGSKDDYAETSLAVARDVVATLERFGVATSWDGSLGTKIEIVPFEWKQRLNTPSPIVIPILERPRPSPDLLN